MSKPTIAIASDHAGFKQKQQLAEWLAEQDYAVNDLGPFDEDRVDYPDYAALVAQEVSAGTATFGVLVCGTGIGMAVAANKLKGIRAVNAITPEFAALSREHNDANILTLSGRFVSLETNKQSVENFLTTPFAAGRHTQRIQKITSLENHTSQ
jgi:ribose 5-phosphate isomerase B